MHIVRLQGGLGNQLFQYALYRQLQTMGKDTYMDLRLYKEHQDVRLLDLPNLGIQLREADRKDVLRLSGNEKNYWDRIILRLNLKKTYYREDTISFKPDWLEVKEGYYNGYWQSEKYFRTIRDALLQEICFPPLEDLSNQMLQDEINRTNSVSIHIRLGDYLKLPKVYGGICTEQYYNQAVKTMKKLIDVPHFFVFSNDIELAKQYFTGSEYTFVDANSEKTGYRDMYLMSQCRHNIIANSSFSWWGAWLNRNPDKVVIAPKNWINGKKVADVWCDDWITIEG